MKTKFQHFSSVLTILSVAILLTIYLAWLFFPLEIKFLDLEKVVYMKAEEILYNYNILLNYLVQNPDALLEVSSFPNYDDNESICVLRTNAGITIDSLAYDHDWHFALLDIV